MIFYLHELNILITCTHDYIETQSDFSSAQTCEHLHLINPSLHQFVMAKTSGSHCDTIYPLLLFPTIMLQGKMAPLETFFLIFHLALVSTEAWLWFGRVCELVFLCQSLFADHLLMHSLISNTWSSLSSKTKSWPHRQEQSLLTALGHGLKDHCPHVSGQRKWQVTVDCPSPQKELTAGSLIEKLWFRTCFVHLPCWHAGKRATPKK